MDNDLFPPEPYRAPEQPGQGPELVNQPAPAPQPATMPVAVSGPNFMSRIGWKIPAAIALIVLLLVGGGIFAYAKGYTFAGFRLLSPEAVWNKFYTKETSKIYHTDFSADYNDPESSDETQSEFGFSLKNVNVKLEGKTYADITDSDNPKVDGNIKFTAGSGNTSFSSGIDYRAMDKVFYYKVGDIPFLSSIFGEALGGKNVDWIKVDTKNLPQDPSVSSDTDWLKSLANDTELQTKVRKIWDDNRAIKLTKYVGREKVNGINTLHFQAGLDQAAAKKAVLDTVTAFAEADKSHNITADDQALIQEATNKFIDKIQIKEFDAWIGSSDDNLYRLHVLSNAPSIVSLIKLAQDPAFSNDPQTQVQKQQFIEDIFNKLGFDATFKFDVNYSDYGKKQDVTAPEGAVDLLDQITQPAADAKRIADVRQMASALELYFNDNNWYPYSLSDLTPKYLEKALTAPTPPGGSCTDQQNTYTYKYFSAQKYELTFCLGAKMGGIEAGVHTLSPSGIQ